VRVERRAQSAIAWAMGSGTGSSSRARRTNARSSRPDLRSATCADDPLVHKRPKLLGCSVSPEIFLTSPSSTCNTMPQPTPQ
jgi:hypothetical protein